MMHIMMSRHDTRHDTSCLPSYFDLAYTCCTERTLMKLNTYKSVTDFGPLIKKTFWHSGFGART